MEKTNLKVKCCELSDFERKFQGKDLFFYIKRNYVVLKETYLYDGYYT